MSPSPRSSRDPAELTAFVGWFDDHTLASTPLAQELRKYIRQQEDERDNGILRRDISLTLVALQDVCVGWLILLTRHPDAFFPLPRPDRPITREDQPDYADILAYSIAIAKNLAKHPDTPPEELSLDEMESQWTGGEPASDAYVNQQARSGDGVQSLSVQNERERRDLAFEAPVVALIPARRSAITRVLERCRAQGDCADPADQAAVAAYLEYLRDVPMDVLLAEQMYGIIPEVPSSVALLWGTQHEFAPASRKNWARDFMTKFVAAVWRATEEVGMAFSLSQHGRDPVARALLDNLDAYHRAAMHLVTRRGETQLALPNLHPARNAPHPVARLAAARRILWYDLAANNASTNGNAGPPRLPWPVWPPHSEAFVQTGARIISRDVGIRTAPLAPWPPHFENFIYTQDMELSHA